MQIEGNQAFPAADEHSDAKQHQRRAEPQLEPERIPHALIISASVKLGAKNSGPRYCAKNADIKHKKQLVGNSNSRHLLRSYLPDHNIVQQSHKISDSVLNHYRHRHRQHQLVKVFCPYQFFP